MRLALASKLKAPFLRFSVDLSFAILSPPKRSANSMRAHAYLSPTSLLTHLAFTHYLQHHCLNNSWPASTITMTFILCSPRRSWGPGGGVVQPQVSRGRSFCHHGKWCLFIWLKKNIASFPAFQTNSNTKVYSVLSSGYIQFSWLGWLLIVCLFKWMIQMDILKMTASVTTCVFGWEHFLRE